jgi:hypothetical protein
MPPSPVEAAASPEPGIGPLDNPATRQDLETAGGVGPLDDLDPPDALAFQGAAQLQPGIAAVGEVVAQPRPVRADRTQDHRGAVAVLHARRVHHRADHQAERVSHDMPLAAFDPFPGVKAPRAAIFVAFTLWRSITPAEGLAPALPVLAPP